MSFEKEIATIDDHFALTLPQQEGTALQPAMSRKRAILAFLMPVFIDLMMDNSHEDWGRPFYPVVE